jgi:hypothetical protein
MSFPRATPNLLRIAPKYAARRVRLPSGVNEVHEKDSLACTSGPAGPD